MKSLAVFLLILSVVFAKIDSKTKNNLHGEKERPTAATTKRPPAAKDVEDVDHRRAYMEVFETKRGEHRNAILSMVGIEDRSQQRRFVEDVVKSVKKILEENKETIERIGHPADAPFPHDSETLRGALSQVMENIAFLSDVTMRFPRIIGKAMKDRKLKAVVIWAFQYAEKSGLIDVETEKVLHQMAQQLEIIPREEGFVNPFDKETTKSELNKAAEEKERRRKEEKSKKTKPSKAKKPDSKRVKIEL